MHKRSTWIGLTMIALLACTAGAWYYAAYYRAGFMTLSDGTLVRDFSVADAGEFARPGHEPMRRRHLELRHSLRNEGTVEIADPSVDAVSRAIAPIFEEAIAGNPHAARILERAGPEARQELLMTLARVIAVMAGLERDRYLAALPEGLTLGRPTAIAAVELTAKEFSNSFAIPADGAPFSAWEEAFAEVFDSTRDYRGGEFLLKRIVSDPASVLVAVAPHQHGRTTHLLEAQYGKEAFERILRTSSQAQPIFYQATPHIMPAGGADHQHRDLADSSILDGSFAFFMEDGSGDRYPVSITATYDASRPPGARWTLMHISRLSSPRVAVGPFFAF